MGLESATYVSGLDASNPLGTDLKSQGDDHLRLIKSTLKATFPNATRALRFMNSVAAQTANYSPAASIVDNLMVPCDASGGAFTVTLPSTPAYDGAQAFIVKTDPTSNAITVSGNGNNINSLASCQLNSQWQAMHLTWVSTLSTWVQVAGYGRGGLVGELKAYSGTSAPCGWLRCNSQTIGSASSGATARAQPDVQALFYHLWDNYSDSVCAVSSGRGASAAADWAANKTIALPDLRGRALFGLDDMGASAASRLANASGLAETTNGASGGSDTVTLVEANLPAHTHAAGTLAADSGGAHTHTVSINYFNEIAGGGTRDGLVRTTEASSGTNSHSTSSNGAHTHTISGSTGSTGSGTAVNNIPPLFLVTWLIKF